MEQPLDSSFGDIATAYAQDVVAGKIVACKWHRLACQRHLKDLERSRNGAMPYVWNPELTDSKGKQYRPGERVCKFAELMPHIKGDWAARGQLIKLERWQIFILASIFGWVHKDTFKRRFRVADVIVPRKNAKSTLAAVIGNYMLAVDGEFGAEVYSGATSQDQAMEVFRPALLMAKATPRFCQQYGVATNASNLSISETNSKFEPVIGKPGDGASPSCAIVDEYHEHKTAELFDTMQTGMGARSQPLILVITTAGADISGPCYLHQVELQKILEGVIENDQRFGIVFTIDEDDDWTSEAAILKANPNFGISVDAEFLQLQQRDAQADPRKQNVFKTKHLNIWVAAASPWLNLFKLQQAGDSSLTIESHEWDGSIEGLDLASKQDIASRVRLAWRQVDGLRHYYAISRNYVPEAALEKPENAHYQGWVNAGHLIATAGNMIKPLTEEEKAFNIFLRKSFKDMSVEEALAVRNTMSTTTAAQGGYTVQSAVASQMIDILKAYGYMRRVASQITTEQGNPLSYPTSDGTSETGEWIAQNTTATGADPTFGTVALNVFKASSKVVAVPYELMQDAQIDIQAMVFKRLSDRIGRISNTGYTVGDGVTMPNGLVTASSVGKTGTTGQTLTIIYDDLVDLIDSLDAAYLDVPTTAQDLPGASPGFMMSQTMRRVIRKLKDTAGRPLWTPSYDAGLGGKASTPDMLMGYPVFINNDMPVPAASAKSLAFGNFHKYLIRDAMDITFFRFDDSAYAKLGQVGFLAWARTGGNLLDVNSVRLYQHSAT